MPDRRLLAAGALAAALAAAGCGSEQQAAPPEARPAGSPQSMPGPGVDVKPATTPSPTPTADATATATPAAGPEEQPGGAGDEAGGPRLEIRVSGSGLSPREVRTPAWLRTTFVLTGARVGAEQVELTGPQGTVDLTFDAPGRFHAALRPGRYVLRVEGAGSSTVLAE